MNIFNSILISLCLLITGQLVFAGPAVLFEDGSETSAARETRISPISGTSRKSLLDQITDYDNSWALRSKRRAGVGVLAAGKLGLYGVNTDLNFTPEDSVMIGFGGGPKYNSFAAEWKHLFGNTAFTPYTSLGFAHWYGAPGNGRSLETSSPSFLATKFLSETERRTGKFGLDLLVPAVGMQYFQLSGPSVGMSVYVEVELLAAFEELNKPIPTGALGAIYYF